MMRSDNVRVEMRFMWDVQATNKVIFTVMWNVFVAQTAICQEILKCFNRRKLNIMTFKKQKQKTNPWLTTATENNICNLVFISTIAEEKQYQVYLPMIYIHNWYLPFKKLNTPHFNSGLSQQAHIVLQEVTETSHVPKILSFLRRYLIGLLRCDITGSQLRKEGWQPILWLSRSLGIQPRQALFQ
jgi:hypothetical protein